MPNLMLHCRMRKFFVRARCAADCRQPSQEQPHEQRPAEIGKDAEQVGTVRSATELGTTKRVPPTTMINKAEVTASPNIIIP